MECQAESSEELQNVCEDVERFIRNTGLFCLDNSKYEQIGLVRETHVGAYEYQEALSYLKDERKNPPILGVAKMHESAH